MRWKLLVIASLLAAIAGAGSAAGLAYLLTGSTARLRSPDALLASAFVLPLAAVTYASIFVYRHTARRRKLQATLTVLFSLALSAAALFAATF